MRDTKGSYGGGAVDEPYRLHSVLEVCVMAIPRFSAEASLKERAGDIVWPTPIKAAWASRRPG